MCGPTTRPLSTSSRWPTVSEVADKSNTCSTPFATYGRKMSLVWIVPVGMFGFLRNSRRRRSFSRCTCASVRLGIRYLPVPSIRLTPLPTFATLDASIPATRPLRSMTVWSRSTGQSTVIGNTVTCSIASGAGVCVRCPEAIVEATNTDDKASVSERNCINPPRHVYSIYVETGCFVPSLGPRIGTSKPLLLLH